MGNNLLGAQGNPHRSLGGQRHGFVHRIGVQRLRPSQHRRQSLDSGAYDVVLRLLRRERAARCLRMKPQPATSFFFCSESLPHLPGPNTSCRTKLGYLFEEIIVAVEEETEPRGEGIYIQTTLHSRPNIRESIRQRESKLLLSRRPRLSNMIAADADSIPQRHML